MIFLQPFFPFIFKGATGPHGPMGAPGPMVKCLNFFFYCSHGFCHWPQAHVDYSELEATFYLKDVLTKAINNHLDYPMRRTDVIYHCPFVTGSCWDARRERTFWTQWYTSKDMTNICFSPFFFLSVYISLSKALHNMAV